MTTRDRLVAIALMSAACNPNTSEEVTGDASLNVGETVIFLKMTGDCKPEWPATGKSSFLPSMKTDCYASPTKQCQVVDVPRRSFQFSYEEFADDPIWGPLFHAGYKTYPAVYHHQQIQWKKTDRGCEVKIHALADMDGDAIFSTYTREVLYRNGDYELQGRSYHLQHE